MIKAFGKGRKALTKFYFTFLYTCSCCKLRLLGKISSFAYPSGPNYTSQGTNLLVWLAPYPEVSFNKITDFFSKPPIVTRLKRGVGEVLNFKRIVVVGWPTPTIHLKMSPYRASYNRF